MTQAGTGTSGAVAGLHGQREGAGPGPRGLQRSLCTPPPSSPNNSAGTDPRYHLRDPPPDRAQGPRREGPRGGGARRPDAAPAPARGVAGGSRTRRRQSAGARPASPTALRASARRSPLAARRLSAAASSTGPSSRLRLSLRCALPAWGVAASLRFRTATPAFWRGGAAGGASVMAASAFCCLRCCRDGGTGHVPLKEMPAVQLDTQHMGEGFPPQTHLHRGPAPASAPPRSAPASRGAPPGPWTSIRGPARAHRRPLREAAPRPGLQPRAAQGLRERRRLERLTLPRRVFQNRQHPFVHWKLQVQHKFTCVVG